MLSDSIHKAMNTANGFVVAARHKAATAGSALPIAGGGGETAEHRADLAHAAEQYRHNRGWVFSCVDLVAKRIAGQRVCIARERESVESPGGSNGVLRHKSLAESPGAGQLPMQVKNRADRLEPLDSHPLLDLLNDPNDLLTCWQMLYATISNLELTGLSIWWITTHKGRQILFPVPTHWIQGVDRERTIWRIQIPRTGQPIDVPGDEVVHFSYPNPADPWGALSPLQAIAEAVTADECIADAQWRVFKQGHFPGLVLTAGKMPSTVQGGVVPYSRPNLTPEQRKQLINAIRKVYEGVHNLGHPIILDGLIEKVEKFSLTPEELDFLNSAKLTKSKILQGFRVSPILLGEVEGANRASATVADEIFVLNKVNPIIEMLSQCLTAWLGPQYSLPGEKLTIWIEQAVPRDPDTQLKRWQFAASRGFVTANEYRRNVLNIADIDGGDNLADSPAGGGGSPAAVKFASEVNPYTLRPLAGF